jgi:hypothetical protein
MPFQHICTPGRIYNNPLGLDFLNFHLFFSESNISGWQYVVGDGSKAGHKRHVFWANRFCK